jgi:two-component system, OmpR family, sensor histidine kinase KdpD
VPDVTRGVLRVYLGAAPGVGKTYRMLDEGWRRRERGTDVVVGFVETHGRALTSAQLRDLEVIPRVVREYRGANLEEMDLEAILARHPKVVLVDELAHTNVPGGTHEKRWRDVEDLLDAGIDVITTVNVQHLESVNDVVEKITGITQRETIPDSIVRQAEQIELVDITPEALRRRMAHGNIYAADKIDASLSNYFRVGNLSALREIALLWLADRVEDALQRYLDDHEISATWETRERLVVGVTGTPSDEALLRRAARIASRTGAELFAVHVINDDALRRAPADTSLARELATEFMGRFQEVVGDDIATTLVTFARAERGTQIVLGASRPHAPWRPPSGVVSKVLRLARDLDVHIIAVGGVAPQRERTRRARTRVTGARASVAALSGAAALGALTWSLTFAHQSISLSTVTLAYLVIIVGIAIWGGTIVAVASSVAAASLENYYFVAPRHTLNVARPDDLVALSSFLLFAIGTSVAVSRLTRRSRDAERARAEARILARTAGTIATSHDDLRPLLESLRLVYAATRVAVVERREDTWSPIVEVGQETSASSMEFAIDEDHHLVIEGTTIDTPDREFIDAFASRIGAALRSQVIAHDAARLDAIAQAESRRLALLRTLSSDLREPLVALEETASQLAHSDDAVTREALTQRFGAVSEEVHRLNRLLSNILDAGRLDAGDITARFAIVRLDDLVRDALASIDTHSRSLDLQVPDVSVETDRVLASRAIANVLSNACRFSPPDSPVHVRAGVVGDSLELLIIDRGPGINSATRDVLLDPTQHLTGTQLTTGLNLTVAFGLLRLIGATMHMEDTPGGGLAVTVELPLRRTQSEALESDGGRPGPSLL